MMRRRSSPRLDDVDAFIRLAESGHLTATAEELGIPQPTLSRRIARLEEDLGTNLFDRAGRTLTLNTRGRAFLGHARRISAGFTAARTDMERLMDPERGTVRIDFMHSLGTWLVPGLLRAYRAEHAGVQFELHQGAARQLVERVLRDDADLALVGPRPGESRGDGAALGWLRLHRQPLALAVPEGHRLAAENGPVPLSAAAGEPFIGMRAGYGTRQLLEELTTGAGFRPNLVFESMELSTVAGLVSAGLGVALLPMNDPYLAPAGLLLRPLDPPAYRELGVVWRTAAAPAPPVDRFRGFISAAGGDT
ncbi:LysR family transcriptional regulator [Corynebacterium sp. TAE3-ERU16]|uniref:LysR family transcriptional regulator n=1 Tax=Corynebacterium sp. TAE3-ERU16 TaxID=2849493 RepID=UPI001C4372C8|nr:LysR family transcriptional regulator [Corynebacterium sp. TAE3-ERU16]MBV7294257.1 LysR family transcriptional regulator [Corynebacterium sp. TAE3-ERU16]